METRMSYAARARAAYAAAEGATDPLDKAAFRAAARAWERLANPVAGLFSLAPCRRDLEALKQECDRCGADNEEDCAKSDCDEYPRAAPTSAPTAAPIRRFEAVRPPVVIEF